MDFIDFWMAEMSNVPGLDPDGKLTLEAKEAIRSYLIKIFVPSTVTLAIISGIVGYTIKDVAQKEALETALETALSKTTDFMVQLQSKAIDEANQIHQAKKEIDEFHETEKKAAETAKAYLQQQQQLSQRDYSTLAKQLLNDDTFKKSLAEVDVQELSTVNGRLASLEKFVSALKTASDATAAGGDGYTSRCPTGSYAVGFVFQVESGLAHGALWSGQITCRPFVPSGS